MLWILKGYLEKSPELSPAAPLILALVFGLVSDSPLAAMQPANNGSTQLAVLAPVEPRLEDNLIIGTQAIGGPYKFTNEPYPLEVARVVESMGSNLIKFTASPRYTGKPYHLEEVPAINSLKDLLQKHPVYRSLLSMNFIYYHFWAREFCSIKWQDGLEPGEAEILYKEFRDLAVFLLQAYKGTGKKFFVGHWEGDWLLLPARNAKLDPDPVRIRGLIEYLTIRQKAIEDARNSIIGSDVQVFHYTEVNLVIKGLDGKHPTLTNSVLPHVDVDFVSYSSYDSIKKSNMRNAVKAALDHIESKMIPRPNWSCKRVFVGEFAIHASLVDYDPVEHDRRNRDVIAAFVEWGCPFVLYWQVYCNEENPSLPTGHKGFWLIDPTGTKYPLYHTLENFWKSAKVYIREMKNTTGKPPSYAQMQAFTLNYLAGGS